MKLQPKEIILCIGQDVEPKSRTLKAKPTIPPQGGLTQHRQINRPGLSAIAVGGPKEGWRWRRKTWEKPLGTARLLITRIRSGANSLLEAHRCPP